MGKELRIYLEMLWNWVVLSHWFFFSVSTLSAAQVQQIYTYLCMWIDTHTHIYMCIYAHTHTYI